MEAELEAIVAVAPSQARNMLMIEWQQAIEAADA